MTAPVGQRSRRRGLWVAGGVVAAVVLVVAAVVFQPWTAFIDVTVDEEFPAATGPATGDTDGSPAPDDGSVADVVPAPATTVEPAPVLEASGAFTPGTKSASGTAGVYRLADGSRVLRLEDFETSNGPDVFVVLSTAPAGAPSGEVAGTYVSLGSMKGNVGNQNYEIPADVDISAFSSVVIWCERFTESFGSAPLV